MEDGMRSLGATVLQTFVRGVLFLVPIALLAVLLVQAVKLLAGILDPVAKLMPAATLGRMGVANLLAAAATILLCFLAGILAGMNIGRTIGDRLEHLVLRRIPGFTLAKSITHAIAGMQTDSDVRTALAWIEESWVLAFVMERHDNGLSTVFVPSAPTPAAGAIYYLPADRLKLLDVPVSAAVASIMRLGVGSRELFANVSLAPPETAFPRQA
jgi:uncharacterized membrane protein